jgi:hypothetical protein
MAGFLQKRGVKTRQMPWQSFKEGILQAMALAAK